MDMKNHKFRLFTLDIVHSSITQSFHLNGKIAKIASHKNNFHSELLTFYARLFCDMKFNSLQNECPQFHSLIFFTPGSDPYHFCCSSKNSLAAVYCSYLKK